MRTSNIVAYPTEMYSVHRKGTLELGLSIAASSKPEADNSNRTYLPTKCPVPDHFRADGSWRENNIQSRVGGETALTLELQLARVASNTPGHKKAFGDSPVGLLRCNQPL